MGVTSFVDDVSHFLSRHLCFFIRHTEPSSSIARSKRYFVYKRGSSLLTPEKVVSEHIASCLYRLMGVKTPNIRIVKDEFSGEVSYGLASEFLPGYKDIDDLIGGDEALDAIDKGQRVEDRVQTFKEKSRDFHFIGKESLLLGAVWMVEHDLLGEGYSNVGAVRDTADESKYQLVKIDPGEASLTGNIDLFTKEVSLDNPLLHSDFSDAFLNSPRGIAGNHHFKEFFHDIQQKKLQAALMQLAAISDDDIKKHVIREQYLELVSLEFLQTIARTMIARKNHLASLCENVVSITKKDMPLQAVMLPRFYLKAVIRQINKGNAKPVVVELAEESPLEMTA